MRRVYQVSALVCLAFAIWLINEARQMNYFTAIGPGGGFFPLWLGITFAGLSILWLGTVTLQPVEPMPSDFVPDRQGMVRIAAIVAVVAVFGLLVDIIGYQLMMFFMLMFLLTVLGRRNLLVTLAIALGGSVGVFKVFQVWLDVRLPLSSIDFLENLGL